MESFSEQPLKIEAQPGQHILEFAEQLINTAKKENREVVGTFNGIKLVVNPESELTAKDLEEYFFEEIEKRAKAYRESPEGIQSAMKAEERKQNKQQQVNQLIESLGNLNFSDYETVLDWLCNFQVASDHIGVSFDKNKVISIFEDHGFAISANTGENFNEEDPENYAKYIVGQALKGIRDLRVPHQVIHEFTNRWKQKQRFGKQEQQEQIDDKNIEG